MDGNNVKRWLLHTYQVQVPDDWVHACLEWIRDEQGSMLQNEDVKQMVYDQWLVCDLLEIGFGRLPDNLVHKEKYMLKGSYCLQMMSILDVSTTYYSQLQKLEGKENENVSISATQATQQSPKDPKKNRMLMLKLTDGKQPIQGMEYQPIPQLNCDLAPGTKLVVYGDVLCRIGVLMLKKENIRVLGGEVDTLVETNTQINLLKSALGEGERLIQQPPRAQRKDFDVKPMVSFGKKNNSTVNQQGGLGRPGGHIKKSWSQQQQSSTQQQSERKHDIGGSGTDDDFLDHMDIAQLDALEEEWDEDVDDEVLLSQWAHQDQHQQLQPDPPPRPQPNQQSRQQPNIQHATYPERKPSPHNAQPLRGPHRPRGCLSLKNNVKSDTSSQIESAADAAYNDLMEALNDDDDFDIPTEQQVSQRLFGDAYDNTGLSSTEGQSSKSNINNSNRGSLSGHSTHVGRLQLNNNRDINSRVNVKIEPLSQAPSSNTSSDTQPRKRIKSELDELPEIRASASEPPRNKTDDSTNTNVKCESKTQIGMTTPPFTYLLLVMRLWPPKECVFVFVKAYVSTVLGRLEHNGGQYWSLGVKLNDGTEAVDVDLSDQMLASLIGFTATECMEMKIKSKEDRSLKMKMAQGIRQCQQRLVQLSCLMELELSPHRARPYVTRHMMLNTDHVTSLQNRQAR